MPNEIFPGNVGEAGQWSAVLAPMRSRKLELYLIRRSHPGQGNVIREVKDGKEVLTHVTQDQVVKLTLETPPEGEWLSEPTLVGKPDGFRGENDVTDFIRSIVELGATLGIYAGEYKDNAKEMGAVKNHLADMQNISNILLKKITGV